MRQKSQKQHNLAIGDGLAGFGTALQALPAGSARVNTVRVFQDSKMESLISNF